jgi:hypothetical protein
MKKLKLDADSLLVMTFATDAAPQMALAASAEITDCTCQPYFCIRWPTGSGC